VAWKWKWKWRVFWRMLPWSFVIWGCVHFAFEIADLTVEQPITLGGEILYDYGAFLSGIGFFLMIYFGYEYVSRLMRSRPRHP